MEIFSVFYVAGHKIISASSQMLLVIYKIIQHLWKMHLPLVTFPQVFQSKLNEHPKINRSTGLSHYKACWFSWKFTGPNRWTGSKIDPCWLPINQSTLTWNFLVCVPALLPGTSGVNRICLDVLWCRIV